MKYKLSATDVKQGGKTVAEYEIDRPSRDAALSEGVAGLLSDNRFPPEMLALYRGAMARDFSRDEALDQILADFGVQFFMKEVGQSETHPEPPQVPYTMPPATATAQPLPPPGGQFETYATLKPREMLRIKLKQARLWEVELHKQLTRIMKDYNQAKALVNDCRELLKAKPRPVVKRARKVSPISNAQGAQHVQ